MERERERERESNETKCHKRTCVTNTLLLYIVTVTRRSIPAKHLSGKKSTAEESGQSFVRSKIFRLEMSGRENIPVFISYLCEIKRRRRMTTDLLVLLLLDY